MKDWICYRFLILSKMLTNNLLKEVIQNDNPLFQTWYQWRFGFVWIHNDYWYCVSILTNNFHETHLNFAFHAFWCLSQYSWAAQIFVEISLKWKEPPIWFPQRRTQIVRGYFYVKEAFGIYSEWNELDRIAVFFFSRIMDSLMYFATCLGVKFEPDFLQQRNRSVCGQKYCCKNILIFAARISAFQAIFTFDICTEMHHCELRGSS